PEMPCDLRDGHRSSSEPPALHVPNRVLHPIREADIDASIPAEGERIETIDALSRQRHPRIGLQGRVGQSNQSRALRLLKLALHKAASDAPFRVRYGPATCVRAQDRLRDPSDRTGR